MREAHTLKDLDVSMIRSSYSSPQDETPTKIELRKTELELKLKLSCSNVQLPMPYNKSFV